MAKSFFTSRKDTVLASGSANYATKLSAAATSYGLTTAQASAYAAQNATWQGLYLTAITPATRTKSSVAAKDAGRIPLRQMASDLARIINGTPMVTPSMKIDLGISVRATPTPMPAPGTPNRFAVSLASSGALTLKWKCNNPKGSAGTMYQVWRRVGATGAFLYLGGSGDKKFVDNTIPAGSSQVTYQIQAVRSTAVGALAQYNVNFGTGGAGGGVTAVKEVAPMKKAA